MTPTVTPPELDLSVMAPIGFAAAGAMAVLMGEVLLARRKTFLGRPVTSAWIGSLLAVGSMFVLGLALYVAWGSFVDGMPRVFNASHPLYQLDRFSAFVTALLALAGLLTCGLSIAYLAEMRINHGEYYALVLLSLCGMMLMAGSLDFLSVYVGLELMSIPVYVLAGFDRRKLRSNESAIKYFLIGSFASALLLYGVALLYGVTGATSFDGVRSGLDAGNPLGWIGIGLVVVGFAFKVAAVPFHQWAPDVYEGAPSAVTAFMSVAVKTAAFATLLRVLGLALEPATDALTPVLWALAALTMVVGNVMAVIQDNVKRLLAWSSIAHAGTVMIGLVAATPESYSAVVFYLVVYVFMNLGAFGVVVTLASEGQDCERLHAFTGLAKTRPALAGLMTLFLLSLAGIPGTAGFIAKFGIFAAAIRSDLIGLAILGVLTSVVSVYYYLRIPVLMYMHEPEEDIAPRGDVASGEALVLGICAFAVLFLGLFPNDGSLPILGDIQMLDWARESVRILFAS